MNSYHRELKDWATAYQDYSFILSTTHTTFACTSLVNTKTPHLILTALEIKRNFQEMRKLFTVLLDFWKSFSLPRGRLKLFQELGSAAFLTTAVLA